MINNWFKLYARHFWKNKFFSILNLLGLSIGIAALVMVLLYWNNEHSYNQWNPYKDRVYEVYRVDGEEGRISPWVPAPIVTKLEELSDILDSYTLLWDYVEKLSIQIDNKKEFIYNLQDHQATYLDMFPFPEVFGSIKDFQENKFDAIALEKKQAERLFGIGTDPTGREIIIDGGKRLIIRLVYEIPFLTSEAPLAFISYSGEQMIIDNNDVWSDYNYKLLIKLKEGIALETVKSRLINTLFQPFLNRDSQRIGISEIEYQKRFVKNDPIVFFDLKSSHLNPRSQIFGSGSNANKILNSMLAVSSLILLLNILNTINLTIVKNFRRIKEVGIRKTLGGTKADILFQFVFETFFTVLIAFIIGLVLVEVLTPFLNLLVDRELKFNISQSLYLLIILFIIIFTLTAFLPAIFIASLKPNYVLKGNILKSKSNVSLRNVLLVLQFIIAFFFLSLAILMNKQVNYLIHQDIGLNGDQIINIRFNLSGLQNRYEVYNSFREDLLKINGVEYIAAHSLEFGGNLGSSSTNFIDGKTLYSGNIIIDYSFLDLFQIELKEGRFFDSNSKTDGQTKVLVNEAFEKEVNFKDGVIGKDIRWNGNYFKVIGVVKNFNTGGVGVEATPQTYFLGNAADWFHHIMETVSIKVDAKDIQETISKIEKFWNQRVDLVYPMEYGFANDQFANTYRKAIYQKTLFLVLMFVSIFIALLGLLAVVSFSIESRLKEVAIRKVLGADRKELIIDLSKKYLILCMLSFIISIYPVYYAINLWLEDFVYRIDITVFPFLLGFIILSILSAFLVVWKSWQATQVNVLKYINYE